MVVLNLNFYDLEACQVESDRVLDILVKMESDLSPELERIIFEHAMMIKSLAQTYVRVDTGSLQKSIRVEYIARHHIAVRAGGYIVNPKTGRYVDYAGWVEANYPYMRPAYEYVLPMLDTSIDNLMMRLTEGL